MNNVGSINGKVEILVNESNGNISLIASSNLVQLSKEEAADLSAVLFWAAHDCTTMWLNMGKFKNFQSRETNATKEQ